MSRRVANTCAERKFGGATRKQIIMFLADKASDDGSGIWCSKRTIQRHTELGRTTVKRTVREFLKEVILVETGVQTCKNGFTTDYRIDLTKFEALETEIETESTAVSVQSGPGIGATTAPKPSINHLPRRRRMKKLKGFWRPIRLRGKAACIAQFEEGVAPGDLLQAAIAYATDIAGSEEQTARRLMSDTGAANTGPCEGRHAYPSNPTGAGETRTKEPLVETFGFR